MAPAMAEASSGQRGRGVLIVLTVVAAPVALGFETLLRWLLMPEDFDVLRQFLRPTLTPVAWGLVIACAIGGFVGLLLHRRAVARAMARVPPGADASEVASRARVGAFMLGASVPQVPAILATFTFMFGASLLPVLVSIGVVTVFVVVLAVLTRRQR